MERKLPQAIKSSRLALESGAAPQDTIPAVKRPDAVVLNIWAGEGAGGALLKPQQLSLWARLRGRWDRLWQRADQLRRRSRLSHGSQEALSPSPSTLPFPCHSDRQEAGTQREVVARRWQWAARAVISSRRMMRDVDLLNNRLAPAADRLHALVDLEVRLTAYPQHRKQLALALAKRREQRFTSFTDHVVNELFITGERIFEFFTPPRMGSHGMYFTVVFLTLMLVTYWNMAGQYPAYKALTRPSSLECLQQQRQNGTLPYGPSQLLRWMSPKEDNWCFGGKVGAFDAEFLILWGARWGPDMTKAPQRWVTSIFLHQNFMHLLSNCLLFVGLSVPMERKYGTWRIVLLWVLSTLGGNLFSAVFENVCIAVVGASGGIFGIFGLFVADMIINFETLQRPLLRSIILLAFFTFFVVTIATTPTGTSHLSHVGGFICGLFPAFLFLPNLHKERFEAWLPILGGVVALAVYVTLPTYFYVAQYPSINC